MGEHTKVNITQMLKTLDIFINQLHPFSSTLSTNKYTDSFLD